MTENIERNQSRGSGHNLNSSFDNFNKLKVPVVIFRLDFQKLVVTMKMVRVLPISHIRHQTSHSVYQCHFFGLQKVGQIEGFHS